MRRIHRLAALFLAVATAPAPAQTVYSGCVQRDELNCRTRRERHQLGVYGVQAIDHLARDGVEARRLFILDARYGDAGLITFFRDHGGPPRLRVQPPGYGLRRPPPLTVDVPLSLWEEIRVESGAFHEGRRMAALAPDAICAHAWTYIVETATPAEGTVLPRSAVRIVDQCSGPHHPGWLADRALGLVPACASLIELSGTPYDAVMLCARLRAEPPAVDVYLALAPLFEWGNRDSAAVRAAFAPDAALDWDRGPESRGNAADRWVREMQSRGAALGFDRIESLAGGRMRLIGFVAFSHQQGGGEARDYRARAVLELARDGAGRFRIVSARIARYHPV